MTTKEAYRKGWIDGIRGHRGFAPFEIPTALLPDYWAGYGVGREKRGV